MGEGSPYRIRDLLDRMRREGRGALAEALGAYVLVGSTAERDTGSAWSFATHAVRPWEDGGDERAFDLDSSIVHALRKRTSTFAGVILVGRASSNDVCIDHGTISKLHARVRLGEQHLFVEDAGSRNGTFVEGERVRREAAVYAGDTVRFGTCVFGVHDTPRFLDTLGRLIG
ncbi:MAG: FHA domain-containing protein [Sandaracinaceae bacterium]|nr:FHA domain-containing protein [Sandaracinaceae bacterium]